MRSQIERVQKEVLEAIAAAGSVSTLNGIRTRVFGGSGSFALLNRLLKEIPKEKKPYFGRLLGDLRQTVNTSLEKRESFLRKEWDQAVVRELDLTLPGTASEYGAVHPLTCLLNRAVAVCRRMGFAYATGPDIETEWRCFDALNTPSDHPARNERNTFYLQDGRLLRTHTSTIQIRTMECQPPPIRVFGSGAAYRRDEVDATHLMQFHQLEGLYISRNVSLANLKGTIVFFFRELFGQETEVRFRPHFFPFTVPSYEIDVRSAMVGNRWLELAGCGMVDPAIFEAVSSKRGDRVYSPEVVSGFAFGIGLERLTMALNGIADIRMLIENDIRFLSQF
ncbi:MAG: phenylalanine--tRNA ligase subunit alpha [Candidatus Xiphinematobacter sp.]|nr:MAG: phenylalanine--tRNA ligase subunit alpha [Candidatus Xiphinematobacter sp.]